MCLKRLTAGMLMSFAVALMMTLAGCSLIRWGETKTIPSTPILKSMTRVTLDGVEGVWMDKDDARVLVQWIIDVENCAK